LLNRKKFQKYYSGGPIHAITGALTKKEKNALKRVYALFVGR